MFGRIVKTDRSIEVCPTFRDFSHKEQGAAHETMADHKRNWFSLFDQQACPLSSRLGVRRSMSFDMDKWGYERHLKLNLFATQRGCRGQRRDLRKRSCKLLYCFSQRRTLQRSLSGFAQPFYGRLGLACSGEMMCQQLWLRRGGGGEHVMQDLGDTLVQKLAATLEQVLI